MRRLLAGLVVCVTLLSAAEAHAALSLAPAFQDSAADPVSAKAPIFVTAPPGDASRLFVVERAGRIRVAVDGVMQDAPFLDIRSRVTINGEAGLLSMAFAPDYATSGRFYVYFVQGSDGHIHVEEFTRSVGNPNVANPSPARVVLDVAHPSFTNHYGGQIAFGSDGKLYAGTGDGGSANDPSGNAQNPASRLGKLLAIDTSANPATVTATAIGLRNPFRFSFDRGNGDLVLGDVGQAQWEEIDWVPFANLPGSNFGWACYEGYEHVDTSCDPSPRVDPVLVYANPNGASPPSAAVTGGVVVRDPALTPVYGRYLYADFFAGQVHSAALAKPVTDDRVETALPTIPQLVDFGEDAAGHVYVVSLAGSVQRIVCDASCPAPSGGGTSSGPSAPPDTGGSQGGAEPQPTAAAADTTPPRLTIRAARVQDVLRRRELRLSVACDEACIVRASAPGARTVLKHLEAGKRVVYRLRTPARVRRALARRGRVTITLRGRDATGNLRTAKLTVRVKRR